MKSTDVKMHRPIDRSDPGFTIKGFVLRWISGKVAENSPGRPWGVIRKQECDKGLLDHIEKFNPNAFSAGDTIRRGDLILAYATKEIADKYKAEVRLAAKEQEKMVRRSPDGKVGKPGVSLEINEERDVTQAMIEKFKKEES